MSSHPRTQRGAGLWAGRLRGGCDAHDRQFGGGAVGIGLQLCCWLSDTLGRVRVGMSDDYATVIPGAAHVPMIASPVA
jgi:hypothetical protein